MEVMDTITRRKSSKFLIQFFFVHKLLTSLDHMLKYALIELMKYIRCDSQVNIAMREIKPKRLKYPSSYIFRHALCTEGRVGLYGDIGMVNDWWGPMLCTSGETLYFSQFIGSSPTLGTCTVLGTGNQALLRIIGHVASQNGKHQAYKTISTHNLYSTVFCIFERFQNDSKGVVEEMLYPGRYFSSR